MSQAQQDSGAGPVTKSPSPAKGNPSIVRPHNTHHHHHSEGAANLSDPLKAFEYHMLAHPSNLPGPYQRYSTSTLTVPSARHVPRQMVYRSPSLPHSLSFAPALSPARSPAQISPAASRSPSHSRTSSPSPSPDARRCMDAMAAWKPRFDRRASFNGQEYRRAQMLQTTGIDHVDSESHEVHEVQSRVQAQVPAQVPAPVQAQAPAPIHEVHEDEETEDHSDHDSHSIHSDHSFENYTFSSAPRSCHMPSHTHTHNNSCSSYEMDRGFSECLDGIRGREELLG